MKIFVILAAVIAVCVEAKPQPLHSDVWTSMSPYPTGSIYSMKYHMLPTPFEPYDPGFAFSYGYPTFYPGEVPMTQLPNGNWVYLPASTLVGEKDAEKKPEGNKDEEKKPEEHKVVEIKMEEKKADEMKPEEHKVVEIKMEEKKADEMKPEEHKVVEIKMEEKKADEMKPEAHKVEENMPEKKDEMMDEEKKSEKM